MIGNQLGDNNEGIRVQFHPLRLSCSVKLDLGSPHRLPESKPM